MTRSLHLRLRAHADRPLRRRAGQRPRRRSRGAADPRAHAPASRPRRRRSTRSFSAAPTRRARTTATSRAWRSCSRACRNPFPARPSTACAPRAWTRSPPRRAAIKAGEIELAIAGGAESMTRAPFVMGKAQAPFQRSAEIFDTTIGWRFVNPMMKKLYGVDSMPETAENVADEYQVSRADQDAFALRSQQRAAAAQAKGDVRRGNRRGRDQGSQRERDAASRRTSIRAPTRRSRRWPSSAASCARTAA